MFYNPGSSSETASRMGSATASQRGGGPYPDLPIYNNYRPTGAQLKSSGSPDGSDLIKLFRDKIRTRGVRGIIGLQKLFSIMDDDGSKSISLFEFSKACKDFRVGINEENVPLIFDLFDSNHDGTLNVDEFLMAIRGEMNDFRRSLVEKAFASLDRNGNGWLEVEDIKERYSAKRHPDVVQGKKSEEQILMDFIETFETHHNLRTRSTRDAKVTLEEFVEYYANVSVSIDSDEYFQVMMKNSWNITGDAQTYQKYNKSWANEDTVSQSSQRSSTAMSQVKGDPVRRSGVASKDNPLATTTIEYYKPATTASRGNASSQMYSKPPMPKEVEIQ
jgi:Ca2+-binding EF-hand superfamily protein